jgi:hypothetical protein
MTRSTTDTTTDTPKCPNTTDTPQTPRTKTQVTTTDTTTDTTDTHDHGHDRGVIYPPSVRSRSEIGSREGQRHLGLFALAVTTDGTVPIVRGGRCG